MNFNRTKTKIDANQTEIVNHLRRIGVWVEVTGQPLDTIIFKHTAAFMEIKIKGSKACYTDQQLRFISSTPAPVAIVTSVEEAERFAYHPHGFGLTQKQKDRIAALLATNPKKRYQPSEIEKILEEKR